MDPFVGVWAGLFIGLYKIAWIIGWPVRLVLRGMDHRPRVGDTDECFIRISGMDSECMFCGKRWDTNDPCPPKCGARPELF